MSRMSIMCLLGGSGRARKSRRGHPAQTRNGSGLLVREPVVEVVEVVDVVGPGEERAIAGSGSCRTLELCVQNVCKSKLVSCLLSLVSGLLYSVVYEARRTRRTGTGTGTKTRTRRTRTRTRRKGCSGMGMLVGRGRCSCAFSRRVAADSGPQNACPW
ncbi:hypothetical protein BJ875DRAFT_103567 [Amylocarpus encephaloides]|uniref:Uncharacterized protein n=1 Tax=Amylocarpus encephaloides TaxID=45428 RepID=A0A9P8C3B7_9HELO|nr:hypothetical protein BJ875DRAFT_103567 [Amylocarpus encephaloides]